MSANVPMWTGLKGYSSCAQVGQGTICGFKMQKVRQTSLDTHGGKLTTDGTACFLVYPKAFLLDDLQALADCVRRCRTIQEQKP